MYLTVSWPILKKNAIPLKKYDATYSKPEDDFKYSFIGKEIEKKSLESEVCFFTAPFYFIHATFYEGAGLGPLIHRLTSRCRWEG